jgi:excinuclease ABC subunit C
LDAVPGLGESKRLALLTHFGSVKKIRAASASELTEAKGIGPALAAAIVANLNIQGSDDSAAAPAVNMTTGEILES